MARKRMVKYFPKRRKFTKRQIQRAVDKVIRETLGREAKEAAAQEDAILSEKK